MAAGPPEDALVGTRAHPAISTQIPADGSLAILGSTSRDRPVIDPFPRISGADQSILPALPSRPRPGPTTPGLAAQPRAALGAANTAGQSAPAAAAAPSAQSVVAQAGGGSVAGGGIRPMTAAPVSATSAVFSPESSGGPAPSSTPHPNLILSGGGTTTQGTDSNGNPNGVFTYADPVPVGTVVYIMAGSATGYPISTYTWSGDSGIAGYGVGAPDTSVQSVAVNTNVVKNQGSFQFVVVNPNSSYTVNLSVTYANNMGSSTASLMFNTNAPSTANLNVVQRGTQTAYNDGTNFGVQLSPGVLISASTATDATSTGTFMIMQVANTSYRAYTDGAGTHFRQNNIDYSGNNPPGQNLDGPLIDSGGVAYPHILYTVGNAPAPEGPTSWTGNMPNASGQSPTLSDSPRFAGNVAFSSITATDTFSDYLMYKPSVRSRSANWIALSEMDWNWSNTGSFQGGAFSAPSSLQATPTPKTPSGQAAFPGWVNTSANFLSSAFRT